MKENNLEIALEQLHKALLLIVAREREAQSKCERTKNDITQNIETVFQAVREELVLDALTPFGKKFYSFKMGPLNAVLDELSASNKKEEVLDCAEVKRLYPYLLAAYYLNSANAMKKEWCLADVDDKPFLDVFGEDNLYRELKRYVSRFTLQDIFGAKTEMERIEYLQNLQKKRYWNDKGHTSLGRTQQEAVHQVFVFMLLVLCSTQYEEIIEDIDYRASFEMFQQHTAALYSEYSLSETTELDEEEQSKKEEYLMESFEKLDALKQKLGYQSEIDIEECDYEFEESEFELEEEKYTIEGNFMDDFFSKLNFDKVESEVDAIQEGLKKINLDCLSLDCLEKTSETDRRLILIAAQIVYRLHPNNYCSYWQNVDVVIRLISRKISRESNERMGG